MNNDRPHTSGVREYINCDGQVEQVVGAVKWGKRGGGAIEFPLPFSYTIYTSRVSQVFVRLLQ